MLEDSFTLQEEEVGHSGDVVFFGGGGVGFVFRINGEVGCGVRKLSGDCFEEPVLLFLVSWILRKSDQRKKGSKSQIQALAYWFI